MNIQDLRSSIDNIDSEILALLSERFKLTEMVGIYKYKNGIPAQNKERENSQFKHLEKLSAQYGLNPTYANAIYRCIVDLVIVRHEEIANYGHRVQKERGDPRMGLFNTGEVRQNINLPKMPSMEALGFYIAGHPLTKFEDLLDKFTNANTISLMEKNDGEIVRVGGIIINIRIIKSKKGDVMAFFTLEDRHGTVEIIIFSSFYAAVQELLFEDNAVIIQGRVMNDDNSVKILADTVVPICRAKDLNDDVFEKFIYDSK